MENHHAINGKTHYKLPFSIAMLNYQRVSLLIHSTSFGEICKETSHVSSFQAVKTVPSKPSTFADRTLRRRVVLEASLALALDEMGMCSAANLWDGIGFHQKNKNKTHCSATN